MKLVLVSAYSLKPRVPNFLAAAYSFPCMLGVFAVLFNKGVTLVMGSS